MLLIVLYALKGYEWPIWADRSEFGEHIWLLNFFQFVVNSVMPKVFISQTEANQFMLFALYIVIDMHIKACDGVGLDTSLNRYLIIFIVWCHDIQISIVVFAANKVKQTCHIIFIVFDLLSLSFLNKADTFSFKPTHDSLMVLLNFLIFIIVNNLFLEDIIFSFVYKDHLWKVFRDLNHHCFRVIMQVSDSLGIILILTNFLLISIRIKNNNNFVLFQPTCNFTPIVIFAVRHELNVKDRIEVVLVQFKFLFNCLSSQIDSINCLRTPAE